MFLSNDSKSCIDVYYFQEQRLEVTSRCVSRCWKVSHSRIIRFVCRLKLMFGCQFGLNLDKVDAYTHRRRPICTPSTDTSAHSYFTILSPFSNEWIHKFLHTGDDTAVSSLWYDCELHMSVLSFRSPTLNAEAMRNREHWGVLYCIYAFHATKRCLAWKP
jgi:hypothetical protein